MLEEDHLTLHMNQYRPLKSPHRKGAFLSLRHRGSAKSGLHDLYRMRLEGDRIIVSGAMEAYEVGYDCKNRIKKSCINLRTCNPHLPLQVFRTSQLLSFTEPFTQRRNATSIDQATRN